MPEADERSKLFLHRSWLSAVNLGLQHAEHMCQSVLLPSSPYRLLSRSLCDMGLELFMLMQGSLNSGCCLVRATLMECSLRRGSFTASTLQGSCSLPGLCVWVVPGSRGVRVSTLGGA